MDTSTRFVCQTYRLTERGKGKSMQSVLVQSVTVECKTAAEAEARAHKMWAGGSHAGVDAFSIEVDVELGDYSEPEFIVRLGDVPSTEM